MSWLNKLKQQTSSIVVSKEKYSLRFVVPDIRKNIPKKDENNLLMKLDQQRN